MIALIKFVCNTQFIVGAIIGCLGGFIFKPVLAKLIERLTGAAS